MTELTPEIGKTYEFIAGHDIAIKATVVSEEAFGVGYSQIRSPDRTAEQRYLPAMSRSYGQPRLRVKNAQGTYLLDTTKFAILRELEEKEAN